MTVLLGMLPLNGWAQQSSTATNNVTTGNTNITFEGDTSLPGEPPRGPIIPPNKVDPSGTMLPPIYRNGTDGVPEFYKNQGWDMIFFTPSFLERGISLSAAEKMMEKIEGGMWWWKKEILLEQGTYGTIGESHEEGVSVLANYPDPKQFEVIELTWVEAEGFPRSPIEAVAIKAALAAGKVPGVNHVLFLTGQKYFTRGKSRGIGGVVAGGGFAGSAGTPDDKILAGVGGSGFASAIGFIDNVPKIKVVGFNLKPRAPMINQEEELRGELEAATAEQALLKEELLSNKQKLEEMTAELAKRSVLEFTPPPPGIEFEFGSEKLSPGQEEALGAWVDWYLANQAMIQSAHGELTAVGFADECGGERVNYLVAAKRAKALASLIAKGLADREFASMKIKTLSAGKDWPFVDTAGFSCKEEENRRAVLVFVGPHGIHGDAK